MGKLRSEGPCSTLPDFISKMQPWCGQYNLSLKHIASSREEWKLSLSNGSLWGQAAFKEYNLPFNLMTIILRSLPSWSFTVTTLLSPYINSFPSHTSTVCSFCIYYSKLIVVGYPSEGGALLVSSTTIESSSIFCVLKYVYASNVLAVTTFFGVRKLRKRGRKNRENMLINQILLLTQLNQ